MNYKSFKELVKENLGKYKKEILRIDQKGKYKFNGVVYDYDHILPKSEEKLNIIEEYRESFWKSEYANITFHRYFHHLNSSQALCINLFYPLIAMNHSELICKLLKIDSLNNPTYKFEKESDKEDSFEQTKKTNFDFYIKDTTTRVYVEVKYTEDAFGSAVLDTNHQRKYKEVYEDLLMKNKYIKSEVKNVDFFLKHYQIMRNLVHLDESSYVVFLIPKQNKKVYNQANDAYNHILTDLGRERCKISLVENWIDELIRNDDEKVRSYYKVFKTKYFNM